MIVVEIQDPEDGRVSHEIGPFPTKHDGAIWAVQFVDASGWDSDFVEVRDIDHRIYNPKVPEDMDEIGSFYGIAL